MEPTLYLHLGAHKTGTTSLQGLIKRNAEKLRGQGITALAKPSATMRRDLRNLAWGRDLTGEIRERVRTELLNETQWRPSVLISDEDLVGHKLHPAKQLYPGAGRACRELTELLPHHTPKIIFYIRRQDRFLESCYLQSLNQRNPISFAQFLNHVDTSRLAWSSVTDALAAVVGPENLTVRAFESILTSGKDFARVFFEAFCDPSAMDLELPKANPSLSGLGIELAMAVAPLVDAKQWKPIRRLLQNHFSTRDQPPGQLLSDSQREALAAQYAEDTKSVLQRYGDRN